MCRKLLLLLPLVVLACNHPPDARQAAIAVSVDYDASFQKGCVRVVARDDMGHEKSSDPIPSNKRPVDVAVYREDSWGRKLDVTVSAYEGAGCTGAVVDTQSKSFTLDKAGNQQWAVTVTAEDKDLDGFVAPREGGGGTDCDDTPDIGKNSYPGATEVCDGRDNNCSGDADEGLATQPFYRDADGDGFGDSAVQVQKCGPVAGYVAARSEGFDCNDSQQSIRPGATEVCNTIDDNCVGGVDEGLDRTWYRDADGDGFGTQSDTKVNCAQPTGYIAARSEGFDCNDAKAAVNPGVQEKCNAEDDNCSGANNEGFGLGPCMSADSCSGDVVCSADGLTSACNAPPANVFHLDADGDSEGSVATADVRKACPGSPQPAGTVVNSTDCDDKDPHNRSSGTEICDDRDNNCSGSASEEQDLGGVCGGKGWKAIPSADLPAKDWNTVALGQNGYPVWLAGQAGALAVRRTAGAAFEVISPSLCGNTDWKAAWVRPSDGTVFLVGSTGDMAAFKAGDSSCVKVDTRHSQGGAPNDSSGVLNGIIGFGVPGATTVYAVNDDGRLYAWTPGSDPVFKFDRTPLYLDIHGTSSTKLLLAGTDNTNLALHTSDGSAPGSALHTFTNLPNGTVGQVNGVWAIDDTHAYAVGKAGFVARWNGDTTWNYVNPTPAGVNAELSSVVAIDDSSVYVSEVSGVGAIRRLSPAGWVVHYSANSALQDVAVNAGSTTWDIWAVGYGGVVVHFPE